MEREAEVWAVGISCPILSFRGKERKAFSHSAGNMGTVKAFRSMRRMTLKVIAVPNQSVFRNLYMGFVGGGNQAGEKRKAFGSAGAIARLERRIKIKFREISDPVTVETSSQVPYAMKEGAQRLRFTADEFKMLNEYLNCVEWLTSGAEEIADMFDAVDAATSEEE